MKPYSNWVRCTAQLAAATDRLSFVLPVFVERCGAKTLFSQVKRCLSGRCEIFIRGELHSASATIPRNDVERPDQCPLHFMGRDDTLAAIEMALKRYEGRVAITALHGLRGVGKTTLAAAYAERHCGDYGGSWWARAQAESTLRADLVALGIRLGCVGADDKEEPAIEAMIDRLRQAMAAGRKGRQSRRTD